MKLLCDLGGDFPTFELAFAVVYSGLGLNHLVRHEDGLLRHYYFHLCRSFGHAPALTQADLLGFVGDHVEVQCLTHHEHEVVSKSACARFKSCFNNVRYRKFGPLTDVFLIGKQQAGRAVGGQLERKASFIGAWCEAVSSGGPD